MYYTRSHYSRDMQALHFMRRKMVVYKYFTIDRINRYRQGSPRMLLQKKHPDIDPRVLILEPIEVCSLLNRKKLNAQAIMGRTHGIARGADERVVSHFFGFSSGFEHKKTGQCPGLFLVLLEFVLSSIISIVV